MSINTLKKNALLFLSLLFFFIAISIQAPAFALTPDTSLMLNEQDVAARYTITDVRRQHILVGDERGGGHKFGLGRAGKSEFPKDWDDDKIINTALMIANDIRLPQRPSGRYWLKLGEVEGLHIRVVLNREKMEIVTAYPINVRRNPP